MFNNINNALPHSPHNPFYLWRFIARAGFVAGFLTFILTASPFWVLAAYQITVTVLDWGSYLKGLRCSQYAIPDQLMAENGVTLEQLDDCAAKRRNIRLASLLVAIAFFSLSYGIVPLTFKWSLGAFNLGFIITSMVGTFVLKPYIKNMLPPFFVRDDRYYTPIRGPRLGYISPTQAAALSLLGHWPWGAVDPS